MSKKTFLEQPFKCLEIHTLHQPISFLTGLVKQTVAAGTNAAAQAIVNKDAKKNGYETTMDSIIATSPPSELVGIRDGLVKIKRIYYRRRASRKK